jgi:hypothetical protein
MEPEAPGRTARVIGSLTGNAIQVLAQAVESGVTVLDLSAVDQVDDAAVQVLFRLCPERCSLIACPRWLELWLETARRRCESTTTSATTAGAWERKSPRSYDMRWARPGTRLDPGDAGGEA